MIRKKNDFKEQNERTATDMARIRVGLEASQEEAPWRKPRGENTAIQTE